MFTFELFAQYRKLALLSDSRNVAIIEIYGDGSGALIISNNGMRYDVALFYHLADIDSTLVKAIHAKFEKMQHDNRIDTAIICHTLAILARDNNETWERLYDAYDNPYNHDIPDWLLSDDSYQTRLELRAHCQ